MEPIAFKPNKPIKVNTAAYPQLAGSILSWVYWDVQGLGR